MIFLKIGSKGEVAILVGNLKDFFKKTWNFLSDRKKRQLYSFHCLGALILFYFCLLNYRLCYIMKRLSFCKNICIYGYANDTFFKENKVLHAGRMLIS